VPAGETTPWRCSVCAFVAGEQWRQAPSPESRCIGCGDGPDPCALVRFQLVAANQQLDQLRRAGQTAPRGNDPRAPEREVMDAKEAMTHLRFASVRALYQAVRRGLVPAHKLGSRLRFRRSELDAVLARSR
jgi:hypothetical protein